MFNGKTYREEVLEAVRNIIHNKGQNVFSPNEVIVYLKQNGKEFNESTIRTHITSRCCRNAKSHHGVTYNDFERIGHGEYKLVK